MASMSRFISGREEFVSWSVLGGEKKEDVGGGITKNFKLSNFPTSKKNFWKTF
jgi:hypothetical protein